MLKGKRTVVPNWFWKILALSARITPRTLALALSSIVIKPAK
jgi:hypothetical protein